MEQPPQPIDQLGKAAVIHRGGAQGLQDRTNFVPRSADALVQKLRLDPSGQRRVQQGLLQLKVPFQGLDELIAQSRLVAAASGGRQRPDGGTDFFMVFQQGLQIARLRPRWPERALHASGRLGRPVEFIHGTTGGLWIGNGRLNRR